MIIPAASIEESGPGIDVSNQPEGLAVEMSDPVPDLEYARNAVTLTFDLSGFEHVRLVFEALEYGDEPHSPPPGPFGDGVNFDGVAISVDGVDWYEIQDLRNLRSDKFTAYDIDLDAAVVGVGLSYGSAFRIRFCQYDDNPAPMDGFSIRGIELIGELRPPVLYLTMNDNAATPTVVDASAVHHDQTFVDPGGIRIRRTGSFLAPGYCRGLILPLSRPVRTVKGFAKCFIDSGINTAMRRTMVAHTERALSVVMVNCTEGLEPEELPSSVIQSSRIRERHMPGTGGREIR
jgi:hypothetical protein